MSFSRSFVRKGAGAVLLAALCGCGGAPDDGVRELDLGKAAYEVRDLKKAEKLFEKSLACAPEDVDRLLLLTRVKIDLGDLAAAKEQLDKAAKLAGADADVVLLGAQLAWHMKDYAKAAKGFSSLAENPKLDAEVRSQAYAELGIVEMTCDNHDLARVADRGISTTDRTLALFEYRTGKGLPLFVFWDRGPVKMKYLGRKVKTEAEINEGLELDRDAAPGDSFETRDRTFEWTGAPFKEPVWVDLMTGWAYAVPSDRQIVHATGTTFVRIPAYDSPCVLTERAAVDLMK